MPQALAAADADRDVAAAAAGITAAALLDRVNGYAGELNADGLQRWLLQHELATVDGAGLLRPTARALALGGPLL